MQVRSRLFHPRDDLVALHNLIADGWQARRPAVAFHVGDLHWRLRPQPGRSPARDLRLWHTGKRLLAFAWFDPPDSGDLQCHPRARRGDLEPEMLTWLEDRARASNASSLTVGAFEDDDERHSLLDARGYRQQEGFICHMQRSLSAPLAPASTPAGYGIRPTTPRDLPSLATTLALAFGSKPKPTSAYVALRAGPFYRNELDQVVVTAQGEVAAFCIAWYDEGNRVGLLEPAGCHPDHRRRGLTSALIASVLAALRAAGARSTVVYPHSDNPPARALYARCGFQPCANDHDWQLEF